MRLFISHIHEERGIAEAIRAELVACFGGQVEIFLAEDIPLGTNWFEKIRAALQKSDVLLVLFSKESSIRPWVNIEAGYGVMAEKQVIPVCHSGFSKNSLPAIYGLLQAVDLVVQPDVHRLLDQIARATSAKQFLGDKAGAVSRWVERVSEAIRLRPGFMAPLNAAPCVWVLGSNRGLKEWQAKQNNSFIRFLSQAFMQWRFRVVFGRSGLLDTLGEELNKEMDRVYGLEREMLREFATASAMPSRSADAPPNPVPQRCLAVLPTHHQIQ